MSVMVCAQQSMSQAIVIVNNSKQVSTIKKIPRRRIDAEDRSADPILRSGKRVA